MRLCGVFYVIKLLRFRLISLIGLLYRPKNKIHFCCCFIFVVRSDVVTFLFNLVLLCSHHAKHTIQLLWANLSHFQCFVVWCWLWHTHTHTPKNTIEWGIWHEIMQWFESYCLPGTIVRCSRRISRSYQRRNDNFVLRSHRCCFGSQHSPYHIVGEVVIRHATSYCARYRSTQL